MPHETMTGWVLDSYDLPSGHVAIWIIGEDGIRRRLIMNVPVTFYVSGTPRQIETLEKSLQNQPEPYQAFITIRNEVYHRPTLISVLAIIAEGPLSMRKIYNWVNSQFPHLSYYDIDIPTCIRLTAMYEIFPLCLCSFQIDGEDLCSIQPIETRWQIDRTSPPLRILEIGLDHNPDRVKPKQINLKWEKYSIKIDVEPERAMLINIGSVINKYEPDILMTDWGDTWLFPFLTDAAERRNHPLHLNRDFDFDKLRIQDERTFFSYGAVIHKGQQMYLYGRIHIDKHATVMYGDYGMEGVMEMARITGQGMQTAARVSPGTGISAMQMIVALQNNILVPYKMQKPERMRNLSALMESDRGGTIFEPVLGLHQNVGSLDFSAMYPSLQILWNLTPEAKLPDGSFDQNAPPGILPLTLKPLIEKRLKIKKMLENITNKDIRYEKYKAWSSAGKVLGVVSFGYSGFHLARFGCIEAHEWISKKGRVAILKAKDLAEQDGWEVLSIYIDGITLKRPGRSTPEDFHNLMEKITKETGLTIALDGIYHWLACLPSKADNRVPVANRYFGAFNDGSIKLRGVEARRRDTSPWIVDFQTRLLTFFAKECDPHLLPLHFPEAIEMIRKEYNLLKNDKIPLGDLTISHRLGRNLDEFKANTAAARAGALLAGKGKNYQAGMTLQFIYVKGNPGVLPVDLINDQLTTKVQVDTEQYTTLLLRAAHTIMEPMGASYQYLVDQVVFRSYQLPINLRI